LNIYAESMLKSVLQFSTYDLIVGSKA